MNRMEKIAKIFGRARSVCSADFSLRLWCKNKRRLKSALQALSLTCYLSLLAAEPTSISIVPKREWIENNDAEILLAHIYSVDRQHYGEALEIYRKVLNIPSSDHKERAIEPQEPSKEVSQKSPHTIVTPQDRVSNKLTKVTLGQIFGKELETMEEAISFYRSAYHDDPTDPSLLIEIALLSTYLRDFSEALAILRQLPGHFKTLSLSIRQAELLSALGYIEKSDELFKQMLAQEMDNERIALAYASSLMIWGSFAEAKEIYSRFKKENEWLEEELRELNILIAEEQWLRASDRVSVNIAFANERGWEKLMARWVDIKTALNDTSAALALATDLAKVAPDNTDYQLMVAKILQHLGRYDESLALSSAVAKKTLAPAAFLLAGKSARYLDREEEAIAFFNAARTSPFEAIPAKYALAGDAVSDSLFVQNIIREATSAQELQVWADLYLRAANTEAARVILTAAIEMDPDYIPAHVALADTWATELEYEYAVCIYRSLLVLLPENTRWLLGLARNKAWNRDFDEAIDSYQNVVAQDEENITPRLEQARTAFWGQEICLSRKLYKNLYTDLWNESFTATTRAALATEIRLREAEWNYRRFETMELQEELMEEDRGDPMWKFEYAQSLCSFQRCKEAIAWYSDILHDIPTYTIAFLAREREEQKEHIATNLAYTYWRERGYGDLSQIARYEDVFSVLVPFSCTNKLLISQHTYDEHTFYDSRFHPALGLSAAWDYQPNFYLGLKAGFEWKNYFGHFDQTYTGFGEVDINLLDYATLSFGYTKKNLITNYFNLTQTTQGSISWLSLRSQLSHSTLVTYFCENIVYSDKNNMLHAKVDFQYNVTTYPKAFRIVATGEYRNTENTNVFIYNTAGQLVDIIHPYWAPQRYFFRQLLFGFRHDYGYLEFCEAPERYYDISAYFGDDSQNNPFWAIRAEWVHELFYNWRVSVSALVHRSPLWKANGLWCTVNYVF